MSSPTQDPIKTKQKSIYTLRGVQVMVDEDLAELYGVETRRLNEQVKRNKERFPPEFMFQLHEADLENLRSQIATLNESTLRSQFATSNRGGRRYLPFVFTEQGVAMLSAVLKSETAIKVSIQIMSAFVAMRRFLQTHAQVFQRLDSLELKQYQTDQKVERVLNALEEKSTLPKQGIFYDGQVFDAWRFVSDLVRSAQKSIILIDNYIDDTVLYHIGASLKDLGKKWFAFTKMDMNAVAILENLGKAKLVVK